MTDLISKPIRSSRLLLSWQAPLDSGGPRDRRAVGEIWRERSGNAVFRYLSGTDDLALAQAAGFIGYPAIPDLSDSAIADAEEIFSRRLPPSSRSDFPAFLERFGLDPTAEWSPMDLLGYTGGRLPSDSFGFAETFERFDKPFRYVFDVAGFRHYRDALTKLEEGEPVAFDAEPDNPHDPNAVAIRRAGDLLGHVSRLQAPRVREWALANRIRGRVFRINGRVEYPRLFIMADINPMDEG